MTSFTDVSKAVKSDYTVYIDGVPHKVVYATAGGAVRPIEGVADVYPTSALRQVNVTDIEIRHPY